MKIIVIGGTGTIGKAVVESLKNEHEILVFGYKDGNHLVDLESKKSIKNMFADIPNIDGVISTAGMANFGPLASQSDTDYNLALNNKLMGQVNLVRIGMHHLNSDGFIILTSGMLAHTPMPGSSSVSMVNAGLEGFVKAAALEMPNNIKVNIVSPVFVKETMEMMGMDSTSGTSAADTANVYSSAISLKESGTVLDVAHFLNTTKR